MEKTTVIFRLTNGDINMEATHDDYLRFKDALNDKNTNIIDLTDSIAIQKKHIQFIQFVKEEQPKEEK